MGTKHDLFSEVLNSSNVVSDMGMSTGSRFFVHATDGTDGGAYGDNPSRPYATIDYAISSCTGAKHDIIYAMEGHAETLTAAAGIALDVAGVSLIGLGNRNNRPTVTLGTATTCDVSVTAANVLIRNIKFVSNINDLGMFIDVDAAGCTIEDCYFVTSAAKEAHCFIDLADTIDDLIVTGCEFHQPTDPEGTDAAASTGCIFFSDSENIRIERCLFNGMFETGIFHNRTTKVQNLYINNCFGVQTLPAAEIIHLVAASSGGMKSSLFITTGAADVTVAALIGATSTLFYISDDTSFGNDGGGGQLAVHGETAAT